MKKSIVFTVFLLLAASLLPRCSEKPRTVEKTGISVAISILPLSDFAKQVGGKFITVKTLVPPGASPHTYEPTAGQMKYLANADIVILNGLGLEFWAEKVLNSLDRKDLMVVYAAEGITPLKEEHDEHESEEQHQEEHHHEGGINPHVWMDPVYAAAITEKIRDAFIQYDPVHENHFRNNAALFISQLKALNEEIKESVSGFSSRKFIAFHSAYDYFIARYGLEEAGVIEEIPGKSPSPDLIRNIIETIRTHSVKAIFAEPQFPAKEAEVIAAETGAKVLYIDPLGKGQNYSYISTMKKNLDQLKAAFK